MITAVIREYLLMDPSVAAMVSDRIYIDELPRDPEFPAISVHPVSQTPDPRYNDGYTDLVQISVWDDQNPDKDGRKSTLNLELLKHAVIKRMHHGSAADWVALADVIAGVTVHVHSMRVDGGARLHDPVRGWLHVPLTARIGYILK